MMSVNQYAKGTWGTRLDVNLDILRATVANKVGHHVDNAYVVVVDNCCQRNQDAEFLEKLSYPAALGYDMSNNMILRFNAGSGDHGLVLGGPRNHIVTKEDVEPGCGVPRALQENWASMTTTR